MGHMHEETEEDMAHMTAVKQDESPDKPEEPFAMPPLPGSNKQRNPYKRHPTAGALGPKQQIERKLD